MQEVLKKFGRYFLLDRVAQGGMAEIFRARQTSSEGLGRLLVIKRIQPSYWSNSEFVGMFRSETKVMMNFNHPNIVQLQDYGEENGQPFIAMEYVEGKSLRQLRDRFFERFGGVPVDLAAYLISQAAAGLHYAHVFKDRVSGQSLNIVHRDVSPQNILVSYEGGVKIIDFGIAKASINSEQTRVGVIKGKIGYLSPEQINTSVGPLDGRSDLFSLGTVLWELLTGKKLFSAENEVAALRMIENCNSTVKRPSELNSKVPRELDDLVMQALSKNRDQRFLSCLEFQKKLQKFVVQYNPEFNPADIGGDIKAIFSDEIVEDRKILNRLNERAQNLLSLESAPLVGKTIPAEEERSLGSGSSGSRNYEQTQVDVQGAVQIDESQSSAARTLARSRALSVSQDVQGARSSKMNQKIAPPRAIHSRSSESPAFFRVAMIGLVLMAGFYLYGSSSENLSSTVSIPPSGANRLITGTEQKEQMAVMLRLNPVGGMAHIQVNGKPLGENGGAVLIPTDGPLPVLVPLSKTLRVTVEANGFKPLEYEGVIDPKQFKVGVWGKEVASNLNLEPEVYGILKYRSGLANASLRVEVGGQSWIYRSALTGGTEVVKLPPGTYKLEFFSSSLNMSQIVPSLTVPSGGTVEHDVVLRK